MRFGVPLRGRRLELHTGEFADPRDGVATTLFLDKGDEVIDYRIAESIYRTCGRVILYEGGDHAFQHIHEAIAVMRESL